MNGSTKRFVFGGGIYLFILFLHVGLKHFALVRKLSWLKALLMGSSIIL